MSQDQKPAGIKESTAGIRISQNNVHILPRFNCVIENFRDFIAENGGVPPTHFIAGKLQRIDVSDGRRGNKVCAYVAHFDGVPSIWFQNFKTGFSGTWSAETGEKWTPE